MTNTAYEVRTQTGRVIDRLTDEQEAEWVHDEATRNGWRVYIVWVEQDENGTWWAQED